MYVLMTEQEEFLDKLFEFTEDIEDAMFLKTEAVAKLISNNSSVVLKVKKVKIELE